MPAARLAVATALLAALLTGCSEDPEPKIADPTESAAPPPTPSMSPSAAETATPVTPGTAVHEWVAARNDALGSGDTSKLRALTDLSCQSCVGLITSIEEVYAAGGSYDTKGWTIKSARARAPTGKRQVVDAAVAIAGGTTVETAGATPVQYESENHIMVFKLHDQSGQMLVDFVGFIS